MNQAQITRLMTFAQHGQPKNYAASDLMRSDVEAILVQATELSTEATRLREGWEAAIRVNESSQSQLADQQRIYLDNNVKQADVILELQSELAEAQAENEAVRKANLYGVRINEELRDELAALRTQEPVAWRYHAVSPFADKDGMLKVSDKWTLIPSPNQRDAHSATCGMQAEPLYAAPTAPQPVNQIVATEGMPKGIGDEPEFEPVNQMLLEALRTARDDIDHWAGYASDYFRDKHNLAADLADIDAAIAAAEGVKP